MKRQKSGPEAKIQDDIVKMLRHKGWFVKETHGNMYQSGFPDLYATHHLYGARWIEVKLPEMKGSHWTPAQSRDFPLFTAHGTGIWILVSDSLEEYQKLFEAYNYTYYTDLWRKING